MEYDVSFPVKPIVDILIAVAEKGGVENCVNMIGRYLVGKKIKVRVVQLVYEGYSWADESLEFHSVFDSRKGNTVNKFVEGYKNKLKEIGAPDLVIATAWPMMSYVAKAVAGEIGADYLVASWLHAPITRYEMGGFGGQKGGFGRNSSSGGSVWIFARTSRRLEQNTSRNERPFRRRVPRSSIASAVSASMRSVSRTGSS